MDCRLAGFSVHGDFQARVLEWVAISFLQGIFLTQGSNPGLPHCRHILYQLSHKASLSKFKKTEITSSIFSGHNAMRLEINYKKKKTTKITNTERLNNMLLNNQWITGEIKEEIKKYLETNENKNIAIQNL